MVGLTKTKTLLYQRREIVINWYNLCRKYKGNSVTQDQICVELSEVVENIFYTVFKYCTVEFLFNLSME